MRRFILITYLLLLYFIPANACEVCGCGVGNYVNGIMPSMKRSFLGIRYRIAAFNSHIQNGPLFKTSETFQTYELWYRRQIGNRIQAMLFLPYQHNRQRFYNGLPEKTINGLGDVFLTAAYKLYDQQSKAGDFSVLKQTIWLGGGVKLPTGKYRFTNTDAEVANPNFQLGTGSFDYLLTATHTIQLNAWGLQNDLQLRYNSSNPNQYRFGSRASWQSAVFYTRKRKQSFVPLAGIRAEWVEKDSRQKQQVDVTGGYQVGMLGGLEWQSGQLALGCRAGLPLKQHLGGGNLQEKPNLAVHFTYFLN
ncbi:MAG TPA: hypothetical protein DIW54_11525 [Chitinophagaceae bacterium]|nr:hypothetical protein [Chitinophagaceae bacterium]HCT23910.1 hypothetical protein [Chitinophagaceae bacterium]